MCVRVIFDWTIIYFYKNFAFSDICAILCALHILIDASRRLITLKGITSRSLRECFMQISVESFFSARRYKDFTKKSRRCRISFLVVDLWETVTRSFTLSSPTFSPLLLVFFSGLVLEVTAKGKGAYTRERLVIKSKQKGIDVIEVGSDIFLSLCFFSFSVSRDSSFPREIVSEKMAKITSETALFSTGMVNLYIHGHPFIHCNVNPFLFHVPTVRSTAPCLPPSLSLRFFNFANYMSSCLHNIPLNATLRLLEKKRERETEKKREREISFSIWFHAKRKPPLLRHLSSTPLLY